MLIVNTTYHIAETIEEEWKKWVLEEYVPMVIVPGILKQPRFHHLLIENEPGHQSYALQFEVKDLDSLDFWFKNHGSEMQKSLSDRFHEKALGFTTIMEVIDIE